jgi:hypothetical protein
MRFAVQSWYTAKTSELRYPKLTTAAGSMASFIQLIMGGSIAAGGGFATLRSAAMGGYGAATVGGVAAALGGAFGLQLKASWRQMSARNKTSSKKQITLMKERRLCDLLKVRISR